MFLYTCFYMCLYVFICVLYVFLYMFLCTCICFYIFVFAKRRSIGNRLKAKIYPWNLKILIINNGLGCHSGWFFCFSITCEKNVDYCEQKQILRIVIPHIYTPGSFQHDSTNFQGRMWHMFEKSSHFLSEALYQCN